MKIFHTIKYALTGWLAGGLMSIALGLLWPFIFPAIIRVEHYYGVGPSLPVLTSWAFLFSSPAALLGGVVGGWVPKEGLGTDEYILALLFGGLFALPFIIYCMWLFTGW